MGIARTSRSRLTSQQWVEVKRRRSVADGMYGSLPRYTTIIARYWIRIYPQHHTERSRIELGESADQTTHRGLADLTQNGRTIMIADRMVDTINGLTYDVVEVMRPRGRSSYNLMVQYGLTLVSDGPDSCAQPEAS